MNETFLQVCIKEMYTHFVRTFFNLVFTSI